MSVQLLKLIDRWLRVALIALVIALGGQAAGGLARPEAAMQPMLGRQVFPVDCTFVDSVTPSFVRVADLGTFTIQSPDSVVELTFNGRISVGSFSSGSGARFELRLDDQASSEGRGRANLRAAEAGGGRQVSITAFFSGLEPGEHTASMWVAATTGGAASTAGVDPGCWSTDVLIFKEYTPFGATYLPVVTQ